MLQGLAVDRDWETGEERYIIVCDYFHLHGKEGSTAEPRLKVARLECLKFLKKGVMVTQSFFLSNVLSWIYVK